MRGPAPTRPLSPTLSPLRGARGRNAWASPLACRLTPMPHLPPRASRAPVAATATDAGARPARVFATPTAAASTATSDGTWLVQSPAMPLAASAPEPATPFGGFGTDSPSHLPPRASHAPVAATATVAGARTARSFLHRRRYLCLSRPPPEVASPRTAHPFSPRVLRARPSRPPPWLPEQERLALLTPTADLAPEPATPLRWLRQGQPTPSPPACFARARHGHDHDHDHGHGDGCRSENGSRLCDPPGGISRLKPAPD